jgi:cellulose synthase/poly-beta-1,6-N-acetylglucosamine synthase-like glycosyltransferase/peptidoglycan/xylan/chitin deacetylase (PgdA/CDA1 family)
MPIFFDTSKKRKFYFRGGAVFFLFFILASILLFLFGLSFATSSSSPVTYADAAERYHYYYSAANDKKLAITIDDGPHAPATAELQATLSLYHVPATFFYIGEQVFARPDLVKEASDKGFDIQIHSFTHSPGVDTSYQRIAFELHSTAYLISQITGNKPLFYRPPFLLGIGIDPTINPYIPPSPDMLWTLENGYVPVGSDIDPKDWLATSSEGILAGLAKALHDSPNGHIVLLHEDVQTSHAMGQIITYLRDQGYTLVPLKELLTPPTTIALGQTLKQGDTNQTSGGQVSVLQWFLYKHKFLDPYELTGVYDEQTKSAVLAFQAQNKLINPANPDATIAGITEAHTRQAILRTSQADYKNSAPVLVKNQNILERSGGFLIAGFRLAYVNFFPVVHNFLAVLIFITLLLVLGRSMAVVTLLIYGRMKKPVVYKTQGEAIPGISVLIPAYNEEENIAATVESVIRSSHTRKEIIVIDDGSKDNTSHEVEQVIRRHPQGLVSLIKVENGGKARALNLGLEQAQYGIIVVLDADAVLDQDALTQFAKHFNDPKVGAVAGKVCTTGTSTLLDLFQTLEYAIGQNIDKRAFSTIGAVGVVPGPAGAWSREVIRAQGGFSTDTLVEDQDMTLTVLRAGKRVIYEPNAIAYTETPHSVKNFLKQRFRWVYGTMQCFWKHKGAFLEANGGALSFVVLPNIFIFNIMLPLMYPFADSTLLFGLLLDDWRTLLLPFLLFTGFDVLYAMWGVWREPKAWKLLLAVPLQRIVYRQLLYYTVMRGVVRALEGTGSAWNKFTKVGETRRFYFTSLLTPVPVGVTSESAAMMLQSPQLTSEEVTVALQGPAGISEPSTNLQSVVSLSVMPKHFQSAGETSSPAWAPNVLTGVLDEPNTYAKSSSPFGPTSSH